MKPFPRRTYTLSAFIHDWKMLMSQRDRISEVMGVLISPAFRERLMMVVTAVNGCRYCASYHARESARAGLSNEAIRTLLLGQVPPDTPDEELPALYYAQQWAEENGHPDPEIRQAFEAHYGQEMADGIHIALRMIRMGNLLGNTWDYLLYRLSFGLLGLKPEEKNPAQAPPTL